MCVYASPRPCSADCCCFYFHYKMSVHFHLPAMRTDTRNREREREQRAFVNDIVRATLKAIQIIFDEGRVIQAQIQHPFPLDPHFNGSKTEPNQTIQLLVPSPLLPTITNRTIIVINEAKQSEQSWFSVAPQSVVIS